MVPIEQKSLRILLWLVSIGFFMQTLDGTIVNTTLPAMARSFGESPLRMQSVVVAYSLTMAMLIPASGWLGNLFSRLGSSCMPFLMPLLLQVNLGYSPFQSGLMMPPVAVASILTKRVTTPLITRLGYPLSSTLSIQAA